MPLAAAESPLVLPRLPIPVTGISKSKLRAEVLSGSLIVVSMALLLRSGTGFDWFALALLLAALVRINYVVYRLASDGEIDSVAP